MTELILINISGNDHPGVTATLTAILAKHNAEILDIGQSNIHHILSLGFLIKTDSATSGDIMKDILFKSYELNVRVRFTPVSVADYTEWVGRQGRTRWIITILGRKLDAGHIAAVSRVVAEQELNIDAIRRLTGRLPLDEDDAERAHSKQCVEFSVRGNPRDRSAMQDAFMQIAAKGEVDISLQEDNMYRRCRRLVCFDMDSTLIGTEVIDELADRAGVGDKVKAITERAMRGEIDFNESFRERVALLKGLDTSVMQDIAENLPITEGLDRLMTVLKRTGYKTAILSGGFTYFGNYLKRRFGFDYVYANELEVDDQGRLTGRSIGEIVDGKRKAELLKVMAQVEQVDIQQTVAVGDGANDLPMLSTAGLGIAFHAKPKVKANADQSLSTIGLDGILYFLGFKDSLIQA
ncbi:MAG: phosphoserine phosphatase SerB [Muribaculaceae bacterium]|jgi:phosphoserine phosphatase|nr:phosphoserine phosphatase SerB [Muribaculaceae bacterium]